jgi:hypothetical protein
MSGALQVPARFPSGLSTAVRNTVFGNLPVPNPFAPHIYANDFDDYLASEWTVTTAGAGATAKIAGNGGLVTQTTNGGGTDPQHNLKPYASFQFIAGTQLWFAWAGTITTLSSILQVGLQAGGTAFAPVDGVYFTKATGTGAINLVMRTAGVSITVAAIATAVAATRLALGFYYDGRATPTLYAFSSTVSPAIVAFGVPYFTGGDIVTSVGAQAPVNTTLTLPSVVLAPGFGITEGAAAAEVLTTDYIMAANDILRY